MTLLLITPERQGRVVLPLWFRRLQLISGGWRCRVRHFISELQKDIAVACPQIGVAVVLFVGAGVWGALDTGTGAAALESFREIVQSLIDKPLFALIAAIFLRNGSAAALAIFGGTLFGLIPLAAILFNGVLLGSVVRLFPGEAWKLIPHGIFELPAMMVSWGLGLWTGQALMGRSLPRLRERLRTGFRIYLRMVLPLLALAAVIEGIAAHLLRG